MIKSNKAYLVSFNNKILPIIQNKLTALKKPYKKVSDIQSYCLAFSFTQSLSNAFTKSNQAEVLPIFVKVVKCISHPLPNQAKYIII